MICAITYGDDNYSQSKLINSISAKIKGGCDKFISYSRSDIDERFYVNNKSILDEKRGGGYWLWKPYFIDKTLSLLNYGDYLMYSDAGTVYINSISYMIEAIEFYNQDILFSSSIFRERQWCKRDVFEILGMDYELYADTFQSEATFIFLRKTELTVQFIKEWLNYACDRHLITDDENICRVPNADDFISNRHDQSIYSLLGKKYGFKQFKGISDSSEIYKYLDYKDGELFGISRDTLLKDAIEHRKSDIYSRGSYPRIIINTRLTNDSWIRFTKRLIKKIKINLERDKKGKIIEKQYL